uniref:Uncharacterized protein n=1 Tax=Anguilla anguilla TaxID=7936 RepID=A0A0E9TC27_ANGAN
MATSRHLKTQACIFSQFKKQLNRVNVRTFFNRNVDFGNHYLYMLKQKWAFAFHFRPTLHINAI